MTAGRLGDPALPVRAPFSNNDEPRFAPAAHAKRLCPCRNGASAPYRIDVLSIQAVTMETRREGAAANNRSRL